MESSPAKGPLVAVVAEDAALAAAGTAALRDAGVRLYSGSGPVPPGAASVVVLVAGDAPARAALAVERMLRAAPGIAVVVLSRVEDDDAMLAALRSGARGFVLEQSWPGELAGAINRVAAGATVVDPSVAGRIVSGLGVAAGRAPLANRWGLRPREYQTLELLVAGCSNVEIARELGVGIETVKTYLRAVYRALGVRDRAQAIAVALGCRIGATPTRPDDRVRGS